MRFLHRQLSVFLAFFFGSISLNAAPPRDLGQKLFHLNGMRDLIFSLDAFTVAEDLCRPDNFWHYHDASKASYRTFRSFEGRLCENTLVASLSLVICYGKTASPDLRTSFEESKCFTHAIHALGTRHPMDIIVSYMSHNWGVGYMGYHKKFIHQFVCQRKQKMPVTLRSMIQGYCPVHLDDAFKVDL